MQIQSLKIKTSKQEKKKPLAPITDHETAKEVGERFCFRMRHSCSQIHEFESWLC